MGALVGAREDGKLSTGPLPPFGLKRMALGTNELACH